MVLDTESGIAIFNHGSQLLAPVRSLIGQNQIFGLCQIDSGGQSLDQLFQIVWVVVEGVVYEWAGGGRQVGFVL